MQKCLNWYVTDWRLVCVLFASFKPKQSPLRNLIYASLGLPFIQDARIRCSSKKSSKYYHSVPDVWMLIDDVHIEILILIFTDTGSRGLVSCFAVTPAGCTGEVNLLCHYKLNKIFLLPSKDNVLLNTFALFVLCFPQLFRWAYSL